MSFGFYSTYVVLWVLVIFQSLVLIGLLRESVTMRKRLAEMPAGGGGGKDDRLPLGSKAPDFTTREIKSGRTFRRSDLAGRKSILLFLSPACKTCDYLAAEVHGIYHKAEGNLYAVCQGEKDECVKFLASHGVDIPVLLDPDREITERFKVFAPPAAIMLDDKVRIRAYGYPKKGEDVEQIIETSKTQGELEEPAAAADTVEPLAEARAS